MNDDWWRNLSPRQFHGTTAELNPGDVISPDNDARPGRGVAYATPHLSTARVFSGKTGHVYEVEPISTDPEHTWQQPMKYTGRETHIETVSRSGFRVKAKVPKSRRDSYYQGRDS